MTWNKFQGFVGPSYPLKSKAIDAQRLINMYPEMIESGSGKEAQVAYLKSVPGYEHLFTVGSGPIRLIHVDNPLKDGIGPSNRVFIVSGDEVYKAIYDSGTATWGTTLLGTLPTSSGPVFAASAPGTTVFVDGSTLCYAYIYSVSGGLPVDSFGDFPSFGYPGVDNAIKVIWVDGYFVFIQKDSGLYFASDWNSLAVDPLSFASSEGDPDSIISIITNRRDLIIFNERSTEIFANVGNADFPFERVQGGFIEKGCLAISSVAKIDSIVLWLSRDEYGQGIICQLQGMNAERVSTHALEQKIATYTNLSDAKAYTYQIDGHNFYVINFTEATWCYDITTRQWFEQYSLLSGSFNRHRLEYLKFFPYLNQHIAADYETNKIYKLNPDSYLFGTEPIVRERVFPHVSAAGLLMTCHALRIDMEVGVGTNEVGQGHDPKIILQWSNDDGRTWSGEQTKSIGKIGETFKRVIFWSLGSYRKRIYKVRVTDPVRLNILAVDVDIEVGRS